MSMDLQRTRQLRALNAPPAASRNAHRRRHAARACRSDVTSVTQSGQLPASGPYGTGARRWHASCFVSPRFNLRRKSVMPLNLDTYLGVHQDALKLYAQRTAVLANNIANADTPNYKAQDLDFRAVLAGTGSGTPGGGAALALATT